MLLTANFILVKLITVNLEEAKLPVKNFYTSSSAMFSSGSYWDVATALSFYSPEVAPTRNLLLLDRSVNEKEPALWRVLSVWATCAGLWGLGNWGGCSYSSVKGDSPFRWAFLAMLTQALPDLRSLPAVRPRTEPCPS